MFLNQIGRVFILSLVFLALFSIGFSGKCCYDPPSYPVYWCTTVDCYSYGAPNCDYLCDAEGDGYQCVGSNLNVLGCNDFAGCQSSLYDSCDYLYCLGIDSRLKTGCSGSACTTVFVHTCDDYYCFGDALRLEDGCSGGACTSHVDDDCDDYYCNVNERRLETGCPTGSACTTEYTEDCTTDNFCSVGKLYDGTGCSGGACQSDLLDDCDDYYCLGNDRRVEDGCSGAACTTSLVETCPHAGYYCSGYEKWWQGCLSGVCENSYVQTCPSNYYCDGADKRQYYCSGGDCTSYKVETCPTTGSYCTGVGGNDLYDYNGCVTNDCAGTFVESCTTAYFCSATNLYLGDGCSTDTCADHIVDTCDDYYCAANNRRLKTGCTGTACDTEFTEACPTNYYCVGDYDRWKNDGCVTDDCAEHFVQTCTIACIDGVCHELPVVSDEALSTTYVKSGDSISLTFTCTASGGYSADDCWALITREDSSTINKTGSFADSTCTVSGLDTTTYITQTGDFSAEAWCNDTAGYVGQGTAQNGVRVDPSPGSWVQTSGNNGVSLSQSSYANFIEEKPITMTNTLGSLGWTYNIAYSAGAGADLTKTCETSNEGTCDGGTASNTHTGTYDVDAGATDNDYFTAIFTNAFSATSCTKQQCPNTDNNCSQSMAGGYAFQKCNVTASLETIDVASGICTLQDACAAGAGGAYTVVTCSNRGLTISSDDSSSAENFQWKQNNTVTKNESHTQNLTIVMGVTVPFKVEANGTNTDTINYTDVNVSFTSIPSDATMQSGNATSFLVNVTASGTYADITTNYTMPATSTVYGDIVQQDVAYVDEEVSWFREAVWNNSATVTYYNVTGRLTMPVSTNSSTINVTIDSTIVIPYEVNISGGYIKWNTTLSAEDYKTFNITYNTTAPNVTTAVVTGAYNWTRYINLTGPSGLEYTNVKVNATVNETLIVSRLYKEISGVWYEITTNATFSVSKEDIDGNGFYDKMTWYEPSLTGTNYYRITGITGLPMITSCKNATDVWKTCSISTVDDCPKTHVRPTMGTSEAVYWKMECRIYNPNVVTRTLTDKFRVSSEATNILYDDTGEELLWDLYGPYISIDEEVMSPNSYTYHNITWYTPPVFAELSYYYPNESYVDELVEVNVLIRLMNYASENITIDVYKNVRIGYGEEIKLLDEYNETIEEYGTEQGMLSVNLGTILAGEIVNYTLNYRTRVASSSQPNPTYVMRLNVSEYEVTDVQITGDGYIAVYSLNYRKTDYDCDLIDYVSKVSVFQEVLVPEVNTLNFTCDDVYDVEMLNVELRTFGLGDEVKLKIYKQIPSPVTWDEFIAIIINWIMTPWNLFWEWFISFFGLGG